MTNKWVRFIAVPAMAGGMLLSAQVTAPPAPQPPAGQHRQRAQNRRERMVAYLNLTDAQRQQAKAEFQAARQSAQPIRQQLKQVHQQMSQAIKANDGAAIQQLSTQEGALRGQLSAIHHQTFAKLYSNLTPDQRAKADQLGAHMRQMRQQRRMQSQSQSNG